MIFSQYVFYNFVQRVIVRIGLKTKISVSVDLQRFGWTTSHNTDFQQTPLYIAVSED